MINRLDLASRKRCVAIQAGLQMITVKDGEIRICRMVPVLSPSHRRLHALEASKVAPVSTVAGYLNNPYSILRLPGAERTNMALLLRLTKNKPLPPLKSMSDEQHELYQLLVYDREQWTKLMYADAASFVGLQRRLHINISRKISIDREELIMLHFLEIQEFCARDQYWAVTGAKPISGSKEYEAFLAEVSRDAKAVHAVYRLHRELCRPNSEQEFKAQTELEYNLARYDTMIRALKKNMVPNIICEGLPLYPCVAMMNEWLVTGGDAKIYNYRLLDVKNMTENERLVRDFVLQHMDVREDKEPQKPAS